MANSKQEVDVQKLEALRNTALLVWAGAVHNLFSHSEIAVRTREGEDLGAMSVAAFLESVKEELEKAVPRMVE